MYNTLINMIHFAQYGGLESEPRTLAVSECTNASVGGGPHPTSLIYVCSLASGGVTAAQTVGTPITGVV
jgi:hypothetical protein